MDFEQQKRTDKLPEGAEAAHKVMAPLETVNGVREAHEIPEELHKLHEESEQGLEATALDSSEAGTAAQQFAGGASGSGAAQAAPADYSAMEKLMLSGGKGAESDFVPPDLHWDPVADTKPEAEFFAGNSIPSAAASEDGTMVQAAAEEGSGLSGLGAIGGTLGGIGALVNGYEGVHELRQGDNLHGALDLTASGLGATGAALTFLGTGVGAAAAPVLGTAAATVGLESAGDKRGEELGLFGKDKQGQNRGAFVKAWDMSKSAGESADRALGYGLPGAAAKGLAQGVSTVGLEAGAAVDNLGLGFDAMGASSGLFGKDQDGRDRGAFQKENQIGKEAGEGLDNRLGLKQDSTTGKIVGGIAHGATDVALAPGAVVDDLVGGVVGGVKALDHWMFSGTSDEKKGRVDD